MKKLPSRNDNDTQERKQIINYIISKAPHLADIDFSQYSTSGLTVFKQVIDDRLASKQNEKSNDSFFS